MYNIHCIYYIIYLYIYILYYYIYIYIYIIIILYLRKCDKTSITYLESILNQL